MDIKKIYVGDTCNLECIHCPVPNRGFKQRKAEEIVREIKESGGRFQLTGCVLCHENWEDILRTAYEVKGDKISIYSNTTKLADPVKAETVARYVDNIHIPIFGATDYTYTAITNTPGTFVAYEAGIINAKRAGIQLTPHIVANKYLMAEELYVSVDWVTEHFGNAREVHIHVVGPKHVENIIRDRENYIKLKDRVWAFDTDFTDVEWFVALLRRNTRSRIVVHGAPACIFERIANVTVIQRGEFAYVDTCNGCKLRNTCRGVPTWSVEKRLPLRPVR